MQQKILILLGLVATVVLTAFVALSKPTAGIAEKNAASAPDFQEVFSSSLYAAPDAGAKTDVPEKKKPSDNDIMRWCVTKCELACRDANGCDRAYVIGGTKCKWTCKAGTRGEAPIILPK